MQSERAVQATGHPGVHAARHPACDQVPASHPAHHQDHQRYRPAPLLPVSYWINSRTTRARPDEDPHGPNEFRRRPGSLVSSPHRPSLIHAFVTCRVDQCNAVLAGATKSVTDTLQRVVNAAARVVSDTREFDHGLTQI